MSLVCKLLGFWAVSGGTPKKKTEKVGLTLVRWHTIWPKPLILIALVRDERFVDGSTFKAYQVLLQCLLLSSCGLWHLPATTTMRMHMFM